jgi:hypothetical protein
MSPEELAVVKERHEIEVDVRLAGGQTCTEIAKHSRSGEPWKYAAGLADEAHADRAALIDHIDGLQNKLAVEEDRVEELICEKLTLGLAAERDLARQRRAIYRLAALVQGWIAAYADADGWEKSDVKKHRSARGRIRARLAAMEEER